MTVESHTSGCEFTGGVNVPNPSYVSIDNCNSYTHMSGGASKRRRGSKRNSGKKSTKRRPVTQRAKKMRKLRVKTIKKLNTRNERVKRRLYHRKARKDIIKSIDSGSPISDKSLKMVSPHMKKFVKDISKIDTNTSKLSSWPSISSYSPKKKSKSKSKKKLSSKELKELNEARLELKKILQKKPIYDKSSKKNKSSKKKPTKKPTKKPKKLGKKITKKKSKVKLTQSQLDFLEGIKSASKSSSVLKFSDYKSKSSKKNTNKKKKGHTR